MASITPEKLHQEASEGKRKLTPAERRRVISYLEEIGEQMSNYQLAELFQCDEKIIRIDKKKLLKALASSITPENAMGFVARYIQEHDDLIAKAKKGLDKTTAGGSSHRAYLALLSELALKRLKALQEIGVVRKELGNLNVSKEVWQASVDEDGITSVEKKVD